jgi:galacturonosyltransferase
MQILNVPYIANITGLGTAVENKGILQKVTTMLYRIAFMNIRCVFSKQRKPTVFY